MKNRIYLTLLVCMIISCKEKPKDTVNENDVAIEVSDEINTQDNWAELSFDDWQAFKGGAVPKFWTEDDGVIVFHPPTAEERKDENGNRQSFNIVTKESFGSFVLSLEWKISEAGNSGIMWGVSEDDKYVEPYQTGLEIQVLDNDKHPDGKNGTSHQAGALYDLVSPAKDATKPVGEWNVAVITINHNTNKGSSVLNGIEVATFPVGGDELTALLKGSKFETWDGFGAFKKGKIALQDHNDIVSYRNIKIKEL
ncbi:DUF1080 domain-containing protein [Maribacter sp. 2308TA10-17]|uniref:3-keto-disaccharide hydrolase n=1 Tax=Maribacter sp. 2308TA10-17 TaxID=3386276 RepID=UPI0039BD0C25